MYAPSLHVLLVSISFLFFTVKGGSLDGESSSTHQPHLPHPMESVRLPLVTPRDKVSFSRNHATYCMNMCIHLDNSILHTLHLPSPITLIKLIAQREVEVVANTQALT